MVDRVFSRAVLFRRFCIFMADSLSRKLIARKNVGTIMGINSSAGVEPINHSLFADDTLLLGGDSLKMARVFSHIMNHFCIISGALINICKSLMYCWNVEKTTITNIS